MAHGMRYDKQLLDGEFNPEPRWRGPSLLHESLVERLHFTPVQYPSPESPNEWLIYENPRERLVVAAYQVVPGHIAHIFTNNPARAPYEDLGMLVAQAQSTATLISESRLYLDERNGFIGDFLGGMAAGAAVGFLVGSGFIELASQFCGVNIKYDATVVPTVLFAGLLGMYLYERPESQRKNAAARFVIKNMPAHPATFIHGAPAVKLLKQVESKALAQSNQR